LFFLAENRKILHEQEAEKMLILLLAHESTEVQTSAAQALGVMSENLFKIDELFQLQMFCYMYS
jgi:HEAT repeat protein